jgi:hypothetical protein
MMGEGGLVVRAGRVSLYLSRGSEGHLAKKCNMGVSLQIRPLEAGIVTKKRNK